VRENNGKNQTKNIENIAFELAKRMGIARTKWFDACIEGIKMMAKISKSNQSIDSSLKKNADSIIKAFQLVHVLSFIAMQRYLNSEEMGSFTKLLCACVCGNEFKECLPYIERYTELKKQKQGEFHKQFLLFSEDIAFSIAEDTLLVPGIDVTVLDFYSRNLALAAEVFGDNKTYNQLLDSIKKTHGID